MKTAFQTAKGYQAVESKPINILGLELVTHKSPSETLAKGYCHAVTDPATGLALARASTKAAAISLAHDRIARNGADKVRDLLASKEAAPPVEDLPVWTAPERNAPAKADVENIVALISKTVGGLTDREKTAVSRALNSRTGQLKAKSPSAFGDADEALAAAAWQGIQPNGYKVGIVSVFSLRGEARDLYDKLSKVQWPTTFDKDKLALVSAGVW